MSVVPNDGTEFFCKKSHQYDFYHVAGNERNQDGEHGFLKSRVRHEHKSKNSAGEHNHILEKRHQRYYKHRFFVGMDFSVGQKNLECETAQKRYYQIAPQKTASWTVQQNLNASLACIDWQSNYAEKQKNRHGQTSIERA